VHNVDLLRWTMGEVEEVQAYARNVMPFYSLPDNYVVNLRFRGGGIGRLLLALGSRLKTKFCAELNLYGSHGIVTASMTRPEVILNREAGPGEATGPIAVPEANSHAVLIADFVAAVRDRRAPMVDGVEGAKAVAVCEAIIAAAREGRPVVVDHRAFGGCSTMRVATHVIAERIGLISESPSLSSLDGGPRCPAMARKRSTI
jgi:predicted dehydrogenase